MAVRRCRRPLRNRRCLASERWWSGGGCTLSAGANSIISLSFDPTGARLAVGLAADRSSCGLAESDQPIRSLIASRRCCCAFNADGTQIAPAAGWWSTHLERRERRVDQVIRRPRRSVGAIALSADGRQIIRWMGSYRPNHRHRLVTSLCCPVTSIPSVQLRSDDATDRIVGGDAGGYVGVGRRRAISCRCAIATSSMSTASW
jgi:hypothetical protein